MAEPHSPEGAPVQPTEHADEPPVFDVTGLGATAQLPSHVVVDKPSRPYKFVGEGDFDSDVVTITVTGDHTTASIVSAGTAEALRVAKQVHEETKRTIVALGGEPAGGEQHALTGSTEAGSSNTQAAAPSAPVSLEKRTDVAPEVPAAKRRGLGKKLGATVTTMAQRRLAPRAARKASEPAAPAEPAEAVSQTPAAPGAAVATETAAMLKTGEGKKALKFKDMNPAQRAGAAVVAALCVSVPWQIYSIGTGEAPLRLTSPTHVFDPLVHSLKKADHAICHVPIVNKAPVIC